MNAHGTPTRAGEVRLQAGAVATAVRTDDGLCWEVRREHDGTVRMTKHLCQTHHWRKP